MAKLIWSMRALDDLDAACEFEARRCSIHDDSFPERMLALIESIAGHPELGLAAPHWNRDEIRERFSEGHRIVYRVRGGAVEIVAIVQNDSLPR